MTTYRILIIEDQHEVRHMLASGLRLLGPQFDVLEVPSAEEGFLLALRGAVDLLVTDIRLPGISGLELLEKIQARNPELKIILITGVEDSYIRQQVAEADVEAYFFKPLQVDDFINTVLECLEIEGPGELPEPEVVEDSKSPDADPLENLTEQLYLLRTRLDAHAALILDREGRVLAQAGEHPHLFSAPSALLSLIAVWDAGAKFAHALGMGLPNNWMSFSGADQRLSLSNAGQRYILVVVEREPQAPGDWAIVMRSAQKDLAQILEAIPLRVGEMREDGLTASKDMQADAELGDVETLLQHLEGVSLEEDVDAFWDQAVEGDDSMGADSGGALSYDQARKLGLTPD